MKKTAFLVLILFTFLPVEIFAQPGNPNPAPIGGGLIFLLLGGLSLGIFNLKKKNK
jgi:hypothetical protein